MWGKALLLGRGRWRCCRLMEGWWRCWSRSKRERVRANYVLGRLFPSCGATFSRYAVCWSVKTMCIWEGEMKERASRPNIGRFLFDVQWGTQSVWVWFHKRERERKRQEKTGEERSLACAKCVPCVFGPFPFAKSETESEIAARE